MTALDDLITRANNTLSILEGLIEGDAGKIPLVDTSVEYTLPLIAYNADTQVWTLTQATVDTADGLYKGQFILALESGCSVLTINSQNVTTPGDGVPARVKAPPSEEDPTPSFVDVASIAALDGQQVNAFLIRSSIAFEVQVGLTACPPICTIFDYTASDNGATTESDNFYWSNSGNPNAVYVPGVGWESVDTYAFGRDQTLLLIRQEFGETCDVSTIEVQWSGSGYEMWFYSTGGTIADFNPGSTSPQVINVNSEISWFWLGIAVTDHGHGGSASIQKVIIRC